ncbi:hypothetical protein [Bremerella alba]|uniref:Uncharacterized protein n=1 Tax=Bremerella alba TaxID=980252 RepID=A0A7V8V8Q3_9BACT|nr:hypothetical protein [Bremerella alba]MBA2117029.1 hypothetical protein [Bremerella alba]
MTEEHQLLEHIEEGIVTHGGELGGWTQLFDGSLKLFDGRISLSVVIYEGEDGRREMAHCHVYATLHEYDDEVLDACVVGMGEDRDNALREAGGLWVTCVAGPIKSFLDNRPLCMTCQAGVQDGDFSQGYAPGDYGLSGLRAYVGPSLARGIDDEAIHNKLDDSKPWFRYAAESAAPRRVHLVKATILSHGEKGWHRELEIDGHEVAHREENWPAGIGGPDFGYVTRFAVFEFPSNSTEIRYRRELERTIRYFGEHFSDYESVDQLIEAMVGQGFDADTVHEVESVSTIAFGRLYFEATGVQYSSTIIRARRDGTIETDVPLMALPAYSRGRAIGAKLWETLPEEKWHSLTLYNAESNAILSALESGTDAADLSGVKLFPSVVPDRGVSQETMDQAIDMVFKMSQSTRPVGKKPWWKFW